MKNLFCLLLILTAITAFAQAPPPPPGGPPEAAPLPAPPPPPEKLTPEMEQEALEFIGLVAPFRLEETKALRMFNPEEYHRRLMEVLGMKRKLDFLKRNDPDRYQLLLQETKLDQQSQNLAEQYRKAKAPEEKSRIKQELKSLLDQLFDIREKNKEAEIHHLEEDLNRLKSTMTERRKNKAQIVTARLEELLDERTSLKW